MKKAMLLLFLAAIPATGAMASDLRMTVEQPHFTCEGHSSGFTHVAYVPGSTSDDGAAPLPCCDGKIGCAQFLSTNTIVRQATQWHG